MTVKLSDSEFSALWSRHGGARKMAEATGMDQSSLLKRRKAMERRGIRLETRPAPGYESRTPIEWRDAGWTFPREQRLDLSDGSIIVSSDHHYWPGEPSIAHRALLEVIREVKPRVKVLNGDVFDGVSVCRHPPFGWSHRPKVIDELHACQERAGEIEQALPRGCERIWNVGNHDIRFERKLVTDAADYEGLPGFRLADHFPGWEFGWSLLVNGRVMIKHRNAGGVHAAYNNTMKGGLSIVTGHTHLLEVKPWGDYTGRRWGVQTGTLADVRGPQFEYMENGPTAACSGFAVLTFVDGQLAPPELCEVIDGRAWFRGRTIA